MRERQAQLVSVLHWAGQEEPRAADGGGEVGPEDGISMLPSSVPVGESQ
jgi:hypothetical protein